MAVRIGVVAPLSPFVGSVCVMLNEGVPLVVRTDCDEEPRRERGIRRFRSPRSAAWATVLRHSTRSHQEGTRCLALVSYSWRWKSASACGLLRTAFADVSARCSAVFDSDGAASRGESSNDASLSNDMRPIRVATSSAIDDVSEAREMDVSEVRCRSELFAVLEPEACLGSCSVLPGCGKSRVRFRSR